MSLNWPAKLVMMLRQCCCCCTLKTGTIILGVIEIVSANFPSILLIVYRNVSSFSEEQMALKLKKLQFAFMVKLLAISIQTTFEHSTTILAHGLKIPWEEIWMSKGIKLYFCIHQSRSQQDFGACGRFEYLSSATHKTVSKGEWNCNNRACILK